MPPGAEGRRRPWRGHCGPRRAWGAGEGAGLPGAPEVGRALAQMVPGKLKEETSGTVLLEEREELSVEYFWITDLLVPKENSLESWFRKYRVKDKYI